MLACKFLEADKVPEMLPIKSAYSALNLNNFWDSLKSSSFSFLISFSTSSCIDSDSLNSDSAILLTSSNCNWVLNSLVKRSLVAANFFFAASNLYIFSARTVLILATCERLLLSSVANAESWFFKIATSPSIDFFSSSWMESSSRIFANFLS